VRFHVAPNFKGDTQGTKLKKHKTANAADTAQLVNSPSNLFCKLKEPSEREIVFIAWCAQSALQYTHAQNREWAPHWKLGKLHPEKGPFAFHLLANAITEEKVSSPCH
jgi:hypothetical protein